MQNTNGTAKSKLRQRSVWRHPLTFWRQTSRNSDSISVTPASCIAVTLLPYFVLQNSACSSLQFNNNCLCYFTEYFNTKPWHTLHFHVLSQVVSGTNRLFVRAIARLQNKTRKVSSGGVWRHTQLSFKHFPKWHFFFRKVSLEHV